MPSAISTCLSLRGTVALTLALGLAACSDKGADTATAPSAANTPSAPSAEQIASQAQEKNAAALAALDPAELKKRGGQALREQRLYAPAGNNAMEYYLALRKKNAKPDASAESALMDLAPYAVIAAEQALSREDFIEAERLRSLIADADPQAPSLPRITDAIAKGKVQVAQRQTQDAARAEQLAKAAEQARLKAAQQASAPPPVAAPASTPAPTPPPAAPAASTQAAAPPPAAPVVAAPTPAPPPAAPVRSNALVPVNTPQPAYPPEALRARASGQVVVSFMVNADGSVSNVNIVSAKPRGMFERTVQSTVRRWQFQPGGTPQSVTRTFTFSP